MMRGFAMVALLATSAEAQSLDYEPQSGSPTLFTALTRITCADATAVITGQRSDPSMRLLIAGIIAGQIAGDVVVDEGDGQWMRFAYGIREYWILQHCAVLPDALFLDAVYADQRDRWSSG